MDEETRNHLESLHNSINLLSENIDFLIKLEQRTLLIVNQLAYILERVSNKTFDLEEAPDEPSMDRIEEAFVDVRRLFEE